MGDANGDGRGDLVHVVGGTSPIMTWLSNYQP
jgi:hypothetical protein